MRVDEKSAVLLILGHTNDLHVDLVEEALRSKGTPYLRFDTDHYPSVPRFEICLTKGVLTGSVCSEQSNVSISAVRGIWWHRIARPNIVEHSDPTYKPWMQDELTSAIETFATSLHVPIFPDPDRVSAAGRKWRQLTVASAIGFRVPDSMLTSSCPSAKTFCEQHPTVFKTLSHPTVSAPGNNDTQYVYTSLLNSYDLARLDSVEHSVGFFQRFISKRRDIRVTIVGDKCFAVAIDSQSSPHTRVDWRRYDVSRTPHHMIELDEDTKQCCFRFIEYFGLQFGAFDFAEDEQGRLWFLELNPNGLWAWLEVLTGVPISKSIADVLSQYLDGASAAVSGEF